MYQLLPDSFSSPVLIQVADQPIRVTGNPPKHKNTKSSDCEA